MKNPEENFQKNIVNCSYPGRGLVVGLSEEGEFFSFTGLWVEALIAVTEFLNLMEQDFGRRRPIPSKVEDPSLIIYDCMLQYNNLHIVSNGDQTTTIYDSLKKGDSFESALRTRDREPDAPNYTPRISGLLNLEGDSAFYQWSILKKNAANPDLSDRHFFEMSQMKKGLGLCLTTYLGDGEPLPSFAGEPYELPFSGSSADILEKYWSGLDSDNKISLALKKIKASTGEVSIGIKNKF